MTLVAIQIAATHRSTVTNCNIFLHLSRYTRLCVLYYALCAIYSVHIIVRPRVDVDNIISHCMHHCCNMLWCSTTHFDGSIYFSSLTTATVPSDSVLMFWRKCFSWTLPSGGGCGFGWALPLTVKRHHRLLIAQLMFMFMLYIWTPRSFRFFFFVFCYCCQRNGDDCIKAIRWAWTAFFWESVAVAAHWQLYYFIMWRSLRSSYSDNFGFGGTFYSWKFNWHYACTTQSLVV